MEGAVKQRWPSATLALIAFMTTIRFVVIASSDLSDTEAYYVGWARWLDLSYYDHPPLVAWSTWLVSHVGHSAFVLRWVPVAATAVFTWLLYRLGARLFSPRAGFFAVLVVSILPAFAMTSVLVNPEGLLAPLWVGFLILLWDLHEHDEAWRPLALGAVIGVGFLAKYTAVLAVPLTLAFVVAAPRARRWLRRPSFWFSGLVALVIATPVIAWNASRGFPSVRLHLVERAAAPSLATYGANALHALVTQVALFHPLVFPALVVVAAIAVVRGKRDARFRFLAWTSLPTLVFFLIMMIRVSDAEPHWTMVAYMPLAIGAGALVDEWSDRVALRAYVAACVTTAAAVLAGCIVHMNSLVVMNRLRSLYDPASDPFNETVGWSSIRTEILAQTERTSGAVVAGNHNVFCGHLEVALGDEPNVYCLSPRRTEFDFVGRGVVPASAPVVYIETPRYALDPSIALPDRTCTIAEELDITRAERELRHLRIYTCPPVIAHDDRAQASLP